MTGPRLACCKPLCEKGPACLDMVKVCCIFEGVIIPIKILHPPVQLRVIMPNRIAAFKVTRIDWIVSADSCIEPNVRFCERIANKICVSFKKIIQSAE